MTFKYTTIVRIAIAFSAGLWIGGALFTHDYTLARAGTFTLALFVLFLPFRIAVGGGR